MKTLDIVGYRREDMKKSTTNQLRAEGNVPAVLYGDEDPVHFYVPAILFRPIVYTPEVFFINLDVEGTEYKCILQDIQFHPVSEMILHADFLELHEGRKVKMDIPVHFEGQSVGVSKGGTLVKKRRTLKIQALPKNMPEYIPVDITELDFHKAIKVGEVDEKDFEILDTKIASIAVVEIPRSLKAAAAEEAAAEEAAALAELEEGEGAEGAPAEGGAAEEGKAEESKEEGSEE